MNRRLPVEGPLRTTAEREARGEYARIFSECPDSVEVKLENFPKYIRRQDLTRLLARYEIFKKVMDVKGSIVECGVFRGFGLMAWANFSAVLEPANLTRRIYGFDTFCGFPSVDKKDLNRLRTAGKAELSSRHTHRRVVVPEPGESRRHMDQEHHWRTPEQYGLGA